MKFDRSRFKSVEKKIIPDDQLTKIELGTVIQVKRAFYEYVVKDNKTNKQYHMKSEKWTDLQKGDIFSVHVCVKEGTLPIECTLYEHDSNVMILDNSENHTISCISEYSTRTRKISTALYQELETYMKSLQDATNKAYELQETTEDWQDHIPSTDECRQWHFPYWTVHDYISYLSGLKKIGTRLPEPIMYIFKKHMTEKLMDKLLNKWNYIRCIRSFYLLGIKKYMLSSIESFPLEIHFRIRNNPYYYPAIPIELADKLCKIFELGLDPIIRECGLIVRKMHWLLVEKGWTHVPMWYLNKYFPSIKDSEYKSALEDHFGIRFEVVGIENDCIDAAFLIQPYQVETTICNIIRQMLNEDKEKEKEKDEDKKKEKGKEKGKEPILTGVRTSVKMELNAQQEQAIEMACSHRISLIKGGAGTGKTTVISAIAQKIRNKGGICMAVSFTGKAVSRLRDVLQSREPSTMHRLIAQRYAGPEYPKFTHLIIDECSMVTSLLLYNFFKAYNPDSYSVTLVGDINQLEPIEWGGVFEQLISSEVIPTTTLTEIHRTGLNSITINAQAMIRPYTGEEDEEPFRFQEDVQFKIKETDNPGYIRNLLIAFKENGYKASQITCVTPFIKNIEAISSIFQDVFVTGKQYVDVNYYDGGELKTTRWFLSDRVMLTVNVYDGDLFNGDQGVIEAIHYDHIDVRFEDDKLYSFSRDQKVRMGEERSRIKIKELSMDLLIKSYCMTCHKAQGSQYEIVLVYIPQYEGTFITRNLLYTAITRTVKMCFLIGDIPTIYRSVRNVPRSRRETVALRLKYPSP